LQNVGSDFRPFSDPFHDRNAAGRHDLTSLIGAWSFTVPNITQTVEGIPVIFAILTVVGLLAANAVIAATHEGRPRTVWRESLSTTDADSDAQAQRIIEIVDSEDGMLGIILFGDGKSAKTDTSRRGPR
jgi:hypothetical protein